MTGITIEEITQEWGEEEGVRLLALERATASVRPEAMATFVHGGKTNLRRYRQIHTLIENDPVFDREERHHQNQVERYERGCEKAVHLVKKIEQLGLTYEDLTACSAAVDEILPVDVHMKMFVPALMYQTTPEQRDKYLPLAKSFRLLGAYVQTELGHGSNVRGLETTASYEPETQTFLLHSPTLTSIKWWPGGLGKTATHALIVARLLIRGQDYGVHSFIVQIRSLVDHRPLPGITVGDIGPKLGFNSVDNGWLRLVHVRIPRIAQRLYGRLTLSETRRPPGKLMCLDCPGYARDAMLMGQASVTRDGVYSKAEAGADKLVYGSMLSVRAGLVAKAAFTLARALTVAIRYSAVRTQGFIMLQDETSSRMEAPGLRRREYQVLDYPTQQAVLMPLLAWAYALQMTGRFMAKRYRDYISTLDLTLLPEIHALSSGLKALVVTVVSDGIEACRKMCGGHGYSNFSGLPDLVNNYVAITTLEGTQQVLEPQLARFLLRVAMAQKQGGAKSRGERVPGDGQGSDLDYIARAKALLQLKGSCCTSSLETSTHGVYIVDCACVCVYAIKRSSPVAVPNDLLNPCHQLLAFEARAAATLEHAVREVLSFDKPQGDQGGGEAWLGDVLSKCGVSLGKLSRAHCQLVIFRRFHEEVARLEAALQRGPSGSGEADVEVEVGVSEVRVLRDLCHLFALSIMEREMGDFRIADHFNRDQAKLVTQQVARLCRVIRQEAVVLVDSWMMSDWTLNSALGRADGRVYSALYAQALNSPLNKTQITDAYYRHLVRLTHAQSSPKL